MKKLTSFLLTLLLVVAAFGACAESDKPYAGETITFWMQKYGADPATQPAALDKLTADFYEKYHMSNTSMVGEGMDNRSKNGTIGLGVNPDVWRSVIAQWDVEGGKATALRLYPIHLGMELPRYRRGLPAFAEDDELLTHLAELSAPFGTRIDIVDHVGIVRL